MTFELIKYNCSVSGEILNVAIIDDDPYDLQVMKNALHILDSNVRCSLFMFPEKAVRAFSDNGMHPDVIFIDMNMHGKSGFECLVELRKLDHLQNTPIYIYSSRLKGEVQDAIISAGANLVFEKPRQEKWRDVFSEILHGSTPQSV